MCLGVPGKVIERTAATDELPTGTVEFAGVCRQVCLACVPEAEPGDFVIVHAGIAISRLNEEEAGRVFVYLQEAGDSDGWETRR